MGNEKCIPFSALAFLASFILKYHTLLLFTSITTPYILSSWNVSDFLLHEFRPRRDLILVCAFLAAALRIDPGRTKSRRGSTIPPHRWRTSAACDSEKRSQEERSLTGQQAQPVFTSHICIWEEMEQEGEMCHSHMALNVVFIVTLKDTGVQYSLWLLGGGRKSFESKE